MKTKNTDTKHRDKSGNTWKRATAKGALVWGSVYSTASSGAAFVLAPVMTGGTPAFGDIFVDSLIVFPTAGAAKGLLMWRMDKAKEAGDEPLDKFTSKGHKPHKHPLRVKKAA